MGVKRRRVLVLAYYFPPMGMSGVQRVAKFVKYLPENGWECTVLASRPRGYFAFDSSLAEDTERSGVHVHRTPSWDPTRLFSSEQTVAYPSELRRKWFSRISQAVFIPDNKVGWLGPGLQMGRKVLAAQHHDVVLASAPPYTSLVLGAKLSRWFGLPIVADFRDDWLANPRHTYMTRVHRYFHRRLEARVLRQCAHVVTINARIRDSLAQRARDGHANPDFSVIPQGFDPLALARGASPHRERGLMRLVYTGVFYHAQSPGFFLQGLARMLKNHPRARSVVKAEFAGLIPPSFLDLVHSLGLKEVVSYTGYLEHRETMAMQQAADILWMTIGDQPGSSSISTGKLFEYMGTRKPILALVPEGAAADALGQYGASWIVSPSDIDGIATALAGIYESWEAGSLPRGNSEYIKRYDRKELARKLAHILEDVISDTAV